MKKEVYVIAAGRTPIGSFGGQLRSLTATDLGASVIRNIIQKSDIDKNVVQDVLMGCVLQANLGQAPARQAAKFAGLPDGTNCTTINKVCASGMKAVTLATQSILLGDADIVVAGGMESMSNVPFYIEQLRWGNKYGSSNLVDGLQKDGLTDVYDGQAMGMAAELCATEMKISREEQDAYAIESYKRSQAAITKGVFSAEIIPLTIAQRKGSAVTIDKDEEPYNVKFDKIPALKPAFKKDGSVTAANASPMSDGAAALLLVSKEKATELSLKPIAKIIAYADAEQAPEWFTTTPSIAAPKAIGKAGLQINDIDFWEFNEAFSVVGIANAKKLNIDPSRVNVHGGAVALGHPLGASGARIIVTLINVLKHHNGKYGVAAICNGGGGASAIVVENI